MAGSATTESTLDTVAPATIAARLPTVTLIIPCWNDADALRRILPDATCFAGIVQTIVADASENGACEQIAREFGATHVRCPRPNRGAQMNAGARAADGDVLLFHHADTELRADHIAAIQRVATSASFSAGSFYRKFDPAHRKRQWMQRWVRLCNRHWGALYGDQSLFIRRDHFVQIGGFKEIALMEDVEFSRRLRRAGRIVLIDPAVLSSARRHRARGSLRTTIQNISIMILFQLGVSPEWLHRWYYKPKHARQQPAAGK
jgi:rSAM/selenodomain-associated transferase 2